jgi:hypothetical protein
MTLVNVRVRVTTDNTIHRLVTYAEFKDDEGWNTGGEDSDGGIAVQPVDFRLE